MFNRECEAKYDKALEVWQEAFGNLCNYENKIRKNHVLKINEEYNSFLQIEEELHKKLNEARRDYLGKE